VVLEVGVGTGKNMPHYPPRATVTAVDFSLGMLGRARARASAARGRVVFCAADANALPLRTGSIEAAVATFLFCGLPDPLAALRELGRVLVPGGQLLLLLHAVEHRCLFGPAEPGRGGVASTAGWPAELGSVIREAGFEPLAVEDCFHGCVQLVEARRGLTVPNRPD